MDIVDGADYRGIYASPNADDSFRLGRNHVEWRGTTSPARLYGHVDRLDQRYPISEDLV